MKRLAISLVAVIAIIAVLALAVVVLLGTQPGLTLVASWVNRLASSEDSKLEISGLDGVLSGTPSVSSIKLDDGQGTWLTVTGVKTEIAIVPLISGRIEAGLLSADKVDLARLPVSGGTETKPEPSGGGGFSLPGITADIKNIFIREIAIGEPVIGEAATLQLTGNVMLDASPVDLAGNLDIIRTDGTAGEVSADWTIEPETNQLKLALKVHEPGDGLLARTLDIYGLPAVDLDLSGDGTLDNWHSSLSVSLDGKKTVSGEVDLSYTKDRQAVSGTLNGELARLLPQSVTPLFAGTTNIDLAVERTANNTLRIERLTARSQLAELKASGHVLPDSNSVDLQASLTFGTAGSDVAFEIDDQTTVDVGLVRLRSSVTGTMDSANLQLQASISSFSDGTRSLSGIEMHATSPDLNLARRSGVATLDLQVAGLATGQTELDQFVSGPARISGQVTMDGDVIRLEPLDMRFDKVTGRIKGEFDIVEGSAEADLDITADRQEEGLPAQLFGDQPVHLSGKVSKSADNVIAFKDLQAESGNVGLDGKGQLSDGALEFNGNVMLARLSAFNPDLQGSIKARVAVDGEIDDPNFDIEANGSDISILGNALDGLVISAKGKNAVSDLAADLNIKGRFQDQPIAIVAAISQGKGPIPLINTLRVNLPGVTAQGGLQPDATGVVTGELDLAVDSLQDLGPLILRDDLSGSMTGKVVFGNDHDKQSITVSLDSDNLEAVGVKLAKMKAAIDVLDPQGRLGLKVNVTANAISAQGQQVDNAVVNVSGDLSNMPFSVSGRMGGAPLEVAGRVAMKGDVTTIGLDKTRLTYSSIPLSLTQPVEINIRNGAAQMESVELKVGGGNVRVSGTAGENLAMNVEVNSLPLSFIESVAPTGLGQQGTISAKAKISGKASNPDVSYQLDVASVSTDMTRSMKVPLINVTSSGKLASMVLTTTTRIFGAGMDVNAGGKVDLNGKPKLDLSIKGNAPFALAAVPMADAGLQFNGSADLAVAVKGSATAPEITGRVSTRDATFIETNSGLIIRDIAGNIDFTTKKATISSLTGRIGNKGKLNVSGYVDMDFAAGLPADITATVDDGLFSDGEIVTAQFDMKMSVSGPLMGAGKIDGTVDLHRTDIQIPDLLPSSMPLLDVKHINPSSAVAKQTEEIFGTGDRNSNADPSEGLQLALTVDSPGRIYLRGRGIDAEFGGKIEIGGSTAAPLAKGSFRMIRGRMNVLTKRFNFDHGTITFFGPLDPTLDFQTNTTQSGVTYSILVKGTASAPEITFQSDPEMPQDEVLAHIFFGKGLTNLSAVQIAQLASAVAVLSGKGGGGGVLGSLRNFTGLDDIDVQTGEDGKDASVGIGRYLNDRTYLNVEKGVTGDTGKVTIDVELTDHLKLRGEAGIDGNTKLGIQYERDYK